eukprot:TRINITY_DN11961_c0_g1_i2.p1 TRINITY_DN11961_c0_g1~~TRINITY_DN11961_c0_g1_i2.p1  ORF type:complete len:771 (-),score=189.81 TRINITY_DN11961_c0_g1_i2:97-2409(-)
MMRVTVFLALQVGYAFTDQALLEEAMSVDGACPDDEGDGDCSLSLRQLRAQRETPSCSTDTDMPRRVLLFGGKFDPPTAAHAKLSKNALDNGGENCVWFAPSFHPDYNADGSDWKTRLRMLEAVKSSGEMGPTDKVAVTTAFKDSYTLEQALKDADVDALLLLQSKYPKTVFDAQFGADTLTSKKFPMKGWAGLYLQLIVSKGGRVIVVDRSSVPKDELKAAEDELKRMSADASPVTLDFVETPALKDLAEGSAGRIKNAACAVVGPGAGSADVKKLCAGENHLRNCSPDVDGTRRVMLFGGTFDPVTEPHAALSRHALASGGEDCVWFAPSFHPDYIPDKSPFELRLSMLKAVQPSGMLGPPGKVAITTAFKDSYKTGQALNDADTQALLLLQEKYPKTVFDTQFGADTLISKAHPMWDWAGKFLQLIVSKGGRVIVISRQKVPEIELKAAEQQLISKSSDAGNVALDFIETPPLPKLSKADSSRIHEMVCKVAGKKPSDAGGSPDLEKFCAQAVVKPNCSIDADTSRRVVLFGGTFDPPTAAHAALSRNALEKGGEDCVWFAPSYHPDYKPQKSLFELRIKMLNSVEPSGDLGPSDQVAITSAFKESYFKGQDRNDADADALRYLQLKYPKTVFDAQFGADTLTSKQYPMWDWAAKYLRLIANKGGRVIIVGRSGVSEKEMEAAEADLKRKLRDEGSPELAFIETPEITGLGAVSSTRIRNIVCGVLGDKMDEEQLGAAINAGLPMSVADHLNSAPSTLRAYKKRCKD